MPSCRSAADCRQSKMAADHLRDLRDNAQEALREMRLLIFELRRPHSKRVGWSLLCKHGWIPSRGEAVQAELEVDGAEQAHRVPAAIQEEMYQIAERRSTIYSSTLMLNTSMFWSSFRTRPRACRSAMMAVGSTCTSRTKGGMGLTG